MLNILQGLGRSGSHDWGELDVFFAGLKGKLSSSSVEAVITSLKEEEVRDMHVQEGERELHSTPLHSTPLQLDGGEGGEEEEEEGGWGTVGFGLGL